MSDYDDGCPYCGQPPQPVGDGKYFIIHHKPGCNDPNWEGMDDE